MPEKKILFVIHSLEEGGAERVLINLLKRFDYKRYEVDLCVVEKRGIYFGELPHQVKVVSLFNSELISKLFRVLHIRFNINYFYKWLANKKITNSYDVGISFLDSSFTDILFFLDQKIKRKISWVHSSYQTYSNFSRFYSGKYKQRVIRDRYSRLDSIVFVSEDSKKEFEAIFGRFPSMEVIYNMIDAQGIVEKSNEPINESFDTSITNIVALGVLLPVKGYDKLIAATKLLKDDKLKFKIRILGNGYLENELKKQIAALGVEDVVELIGFHYNPFPYLKQSQIFVMTSVSEGLPTALCEAMILGLPAVVTDCSGCRELVDYGEYGIMTTQSVEGIYSGLKELIVSEEKRNYYCVKSLKRAATFDDSKILQEVYNIIDQNQ